MNTLSREIIHGVFISLLTRVSIKVNGRGSNFMIFVFCPFSVEVNSKIIAPIGANFCLLE